MPKPRVGARAGRRARAMRATKWLHGVLVIHCGEARSPVPEPRTATFTPVLQRLRDPAWAFLLIGGVVGVVLFVVMPPFTGIDEVEHFARAYQISEGRMVPERSGFAQDPLLKGAGVCLPVAVARRLQEHASELYLPIIPFANQDRSKSGSGRPPSHRECAAGRRYAEISTFAWYSPIPYAPEAAVFAVARPLGASVDTMSYLGRAAQLVTYLGLVFVAIRRSSRARWALAAGALLPVALFQANSLSPDGITIALSLLVLSTGLRALDRPPGPVPRGMLVEAIGLSLLLALAKPTYVIVTLVFLVPLVDRTRRRGSWPLLVPVGVGLGLSALWQRATSSLFVCDVRFFGVPTASGAQTHEILTRPWDFLAAAGRALGEHGGRWTRELMTIADRVVEWPLVVTVLAAAFFVVLACQQDRAPVRRLRVPERAAFVGIFLVGYLVVIAGWVAYCNGTSMNVVIHPNGRLLAPFVPVLLVGIAPDGPRATRLGRLRVPLAAGLLAFYVVWLFDAARSFRG